MVLTKHHDLNPQVGERLTNLQALPIGAKNRHGIRQMVELKELLGGVDPATCGLAIGQISRAQIGALPTEGGLLRRFCRLRRQGLGRVLV